MPSNAAANPSRHGVTGHTQLPLSRIKKIIALDPDIAMCSNNAAFLITLATEMFIQSLAEQGHNVVKSERKPRRNIQYRDLANAVARTDSLEFLSDIIPRTIPYKEIKAGRATQSQARQSNGTKETGQTTLDVSRPVTNGANGEAISGRVPIRGPGQDTRDDEEFADPNAQLEMENEERGRSEGLAAARLVNGNGKKYESRNGHLDEDTEMN
ncbi:MAG: hypothetical protein M1818_004325 [Claussenomyces sp. TS43310]|nr:MAG: hypothetical protein M1818_004325 [Claussenomyces sp. TS43310]